MKNNELPWLLLVDDDEKNLYSTKRVLDELDINIFTVTSGEEALKAILNIDFFLILMDVQMPGMDGFETTSLIRGNKKFKNIPIIFLTAISKQDKYIDIGYNEGAVDYLFKPVDSHILSSKVKVFLELHLYKKELELLNEELKSKNIKLEESLSEIKTLKGILPICANCKKIKDDKGYWSEVETYIQNHTDAEFSHGLCENCTIELYGNEKWFKKKNL